MNTKILIAALALCIVGMFVVAISMIRVVSNELDEIHRNGGLKSAMESAWCGEGGCDE